MYKNRQNSGKNGKKRSLSCGFSAFVSRHRGAARLLLKIPRILISDTGYSFRSAERHDSVRHASSVFFPYARFSSKSFSSPALLGLIRKFGPVPPSGKQGS
jgi:hypothetical protein